MQQLKTEVTISVPPEYVLIGQTEYQELKQQTLSGTYWNMKDLEQRTGKKSGWIKENILYPERFRKVLDAMNGGCVYYPERQGQTWTFHAMGMSKFLDKHFSDIFKGGN